MTTWTDERIETLKRLQAEGVSCSAIAAELGGVSRNAVIGKLHRLGIGSPRRPGKPRPEHAGTRSAKRERKVLPPRPFNDLTPEIFTDPIALAALESHHCRWPQGEGAAIMFCGTRQVEGVSYCPRHCRMAYQSPADRRRQSAAQRQQARLEMGRAINTSRITVQGEWA